MTQMNTRLYLLQRKFEVVSEIYLWLNPHINVTGEIRDFPEN